MSQKHQSGDSPRQFTPIVFLLGCLAIFVGICIFLYFTSKKDDLSPSFITADEQFDGRQRGITCNCFASDKDTIFLGNDDGAIEQWSLSPPALLHSWSAHNSAVRALIFSHRNKKLYSGGHDGWLKMWNPDTRANERQFFVDREGIRTVALHPLRPWIAVSSGNGSVSVWDIANGDKMIESINTRGIAQSLTFSSDGRHLAFDDNDISDSPGFVCIWDVHPFIEVKRFRPKRSPMHVLFLGDTGTIAIGRSDGEVELWNLDKEEHVVLSSDGVANGALTCLEYHRERGVIAAGHAGGEVSFWDLKTKSEIATIQAHKAGISAIAFAADGQRIITACSDIGFDDKPGHADVKTWRFAR